MLHEPHGRIYWAGSERATEMHGLIEGVVRSDEEAAEQVMDMLTRPDGRARRAAGSATTTSTRTTPPPVP